MGEVESGRLEKAFKASFKFDKATLTGVYCRKVASGLLDVASCSDGASLMTGDIRVEDAFVRCIRQSFD